MRFYTTESLGLSQELTPEGYLLCKDVAIARAGPHLYAPGEVPVRSKDGMIRIERDASELFRPETMLSFEGKPITLDHPAEDVSPANWSRLAKGTLHNVHQGTALENDLLLADLLITDATAIQKVTAKELREVSLGYDADYEELQPGHGSQANMYGNHLALVDRGRCGSRCAIGDSMKNIKWMDRLRTAFTARDEGAFEKALKEPTTDEETETAEEKKKREEKEAEDKEDKKKTSDSLAKLADAVNGFGTRLTKLEKTRDADDETDEEKAKRLKKEKEDQEEKDGKTGDSAALAEMVQDVFARAEILSPGISMPTFDAKATPQRTRDAMCALRLKAVKAAFEGSFKDAVAPFLGQAPNFTALTCDAVNSAFIGASEIVRRGNNTHAQGTFDGAQAAKGVAKQITEINKANAAFWKRGGA